MANRTRIHLRLPEKLVEKIDAYQEENGLPTRTAAIIELLRKALGEI